MSFIVTTSVTIVAAKELMNNTPQVVTLFLGSEVSPALVAANVVGIGLFVFEIVILLVVATSLILSGWIQVLHEKFRARRSLWTYRRFIPHFLFVTARLYLTLLPPVVLLWLGLDWLSETSQHLGSTAVLLAPVVLVLLLNLLLWVLRFRRGMRMANDKSRWLPAEATTPSIQQATSTT